MSPGTPADEYQFYHSDKCYYRLVSNNNLRVRVVALDSNYASGDNIKVYEGDDEDPGTLLGTLVFKCFKHIWSVSFSEYIAKFFDFSFIFWGLPAKAVWYSLGKSENFEKTQKKAARRKFPPSVKAIVL